VALAWVLAKRGVASVIVGARSAAQLENNLGAASLALTEDEVALLDRTSAVPIPYPARAVNLAAR
ncbi:MAG TPA: aldo/keto reductase, partial [Devosia sp.]|nr:aldo/keto reductase [Devosia sp.]